MCSLFEWKLNYFGSKLVSLLSRIMLKSSILLFFVLVKVCLSRNTISTTKNIIPSPRIVILVRYFLVQLAPLMNCMYLCGWVVV